jgi:hypothetical protein
MRWRNGTGILAAAAGLAALAACASGACAQSPSPDTAATNQPPPAERAGAPPRRRVPRVTVYPSSRYYRKCEFALAVEHRLSGDVITPQQRCVWALR